MIHPQVFRPNLFQEIVDECGNGKWLFQSGFKAFAIDTDYSFGILRSAVGDDLRLRCFIKRFRCTGLCVCEKGRGIIDLISRPFFVLAPDSTLDTQVLATWVSSNAKALAAQVLHQKIELNL